MRRSRIALFTALAAAVVSVAGLPSSGSAASKAGASLATFEGTTIDLREGWGPATACLTDGTRTTCFRTEAELDVALATDVAAGGAAALANCGSSLKLYSNTGFGGSVLAFVARGVVTNLSGYGFSNVTSSYSVGACSSTLYDGASGGAPIYPGNTSAGASASSMVAGWDNRISSLYIS